MKGTDNAVKEPLEHPGGRQGVLIMLLRVLIMLLRNRSSTLAGGMARGGSGLRVGVRAGRVREIGAGDLVC